MIFFSVAWGAIWEFTPLVIGSCQSAFLLFLPSTSLTARILDSFDSYKIVNDIIWIWLSSCQPNVWSTTISWCFSGLIMCECSSRSFDSWVNSLKALAYLNFTKMCHPSSWKWNFSWGLFETNGKVYLSSPAFPCGGDSLASTSAITNPKRFTLTLLSSVIL